MASGPRGGGAFPTSSAAWNTQQGASPPPAPPAAHGPAWRHRLWAREPGSWEPLDGGGWPTQALGPGLEIKQPRGENRGSANHPEREPVPNDRRTQIPRHPTPRAARPAGLWGCLARPGHPGTALTGLSSWLGLSLGSGSPGSLARHCCERVGSNEPRFQPAAPSWRCRVSRSNTTSSSSSTWMRDGRWSWDCLPQTLMVVGTSKMPGPCSRRPPQEVCTHRLI